MDLVVGTIVDGKVTGIMKFGAFVALPNGKSGLVHISEIAYTYVNEVSDHLREGQEVKVKIIGIDESGRINLSIKKAMDPPAAETIQKKRPPLQQNQAQRFNTPPPQQSQRPYQPSQRSGQDPSFEDKLKQFMQDSDSKISGNKFYSEKKGSRRSGGKRYYDD
jgi:S1 RNA binding domain protein